MEHKKYYVLLGLGFVIIVILSYVLLAVPAKKPISEGNEETNVQVRIIRLNTPNGGEILASGSTTTIAWDSEGIENVYISLVNGGKEFGTMGPYNAASGKYSWLVPDVSGWVSSGLDPKNFKIFISDASSSEMRDESDATFTITGSTSSR